MFFRRCDAPVRRGARNANRLIHPALHLAQWPDAVQRVGRMQIKAGAGMGQF